MIGDYRGGGDVDEMYTEGFLLHIVFERIGGACFAEFCSMVFAVVNESSSVLLSTLTFL